VTNYAAGPGDAQSKINAMLPGDVLTLNAGNYGSLSIGVNGSLANEIKILGAIATNGTPGPQLSGTVIITGSYLHVEGINVVAASTTAFNINNASHVKFRNTGISGGTGPAVWIHNNAHHIYFSGFEIYTPTGATFSQGIRVGTPSSSWANVNTPDRTNNVKVYDGQTFKIPGWGVQVCEGAHHVLVEDVSVDAGDSADLPPVGAAGGDGSFFSRGSNVQFVRCWSTGPKVNYFKCDRVTVGGVVYGLGQEIKGGGGRPHADLGTVGQQWYAPVASNTDDLKVYQVFFNVFKVVFPPFDDTGGTWSARGWLVPGDQFKKMEIGGPAANYRLPDETLPYGQVFGMGDIYWTGIGGAADQTIIAQTYGTTFTITESGGWLVGYAYFRLNANVAPTVARLYRMDSQLTSTWSLQRREGGDGPDAPLLGDFANLQLWADAFLVWQGVYIDWMINDPRFDALVHDWPVVESTLNLPASTRTTPGWVFNYLATPYALTQYFQYNASFYFPANKVPTNSPGWSVGLLFFDFWGRSYGANGFPVGPLRMLTTRVTGQIAGDASVSNLDNRSGNITNRNSASPSTVGNSSSSFTPPLPGELITPPSIGDFGGAAYALSPIISFARVLPELITVTPDMDLQKILDSRIPGDTVIISGTHTGEFVMRESGLVTKPIHLKGDGTAKLRYRFGQLSFLAALRVKSSYLWLSNIIFEQGRHGVLIEDNAVSIRVENCTARNVRDEGFVVQEDSADVCFLSCSTTDTGLGKIEGSGFRVGRPAGNWIQDAHPDNTNRVLIQSCTVTRAYGSGITCCDGATEVLVKSCSVDHSQGNTPPVANVDGAHGYFSRADQIQFVGCTAIDAPGAGFQLYDSEWFPTTTDYGRLVEVKAGSSTGHGDAGVVSQSEGLKVYVDFTATPAPRVREIEGGWSAAGSNVAVTGFRELAFNSAAQFYPPNQTEL